MLGIHNRSRLSFFSKSSQRRGRQTYRQDVAEWPVKGVSDRGHIEGRAGEAASCEKGADGQPESEDPGRKNKM